MLKFGIEVPIPFCVLVGFLITACDGDRTTLNTSPESDLPRLVGAVSTSNTTVLVSFSNQMGDRATETQNYVIVQENINPEAGALAVVDAQFAGADKTAVQLTTLAQNELTYRVTVSNMFDLDGNPLSGPTNHGGVLVDPTSTTFAGTPPTNGQFLDTDNDGLTDSIEQRGWVVTTISTTGIVSERQVTSDPFAADTDQDGITDDIELQRAVDPRAADTDADGIGDQDEITLYFSSPTKQDTDGDSISDAAEINRNQTSPIHADTDGDNFSDYDEIFERSSNPLIADIPQAELEIVGEIDIRLNIEYEDGTSFTTTDDSRLVTETTDQLATSETFVGRTILSQWDAAKDFINSQLNNGPIAANTMPAARAKAVADPVIAPAAVTATAVAGVLLSVGQAAGSGGAGALGYISSQLPTYTTTSIDRTQNESARQEQASRNHVERSSSGSIGIGLKVRNRGDLSFTLNNLVLTLLQRDPITRDSFKALATLDLADEIKDGITLGPFNGETGVLRVDVAAAPANLIKDLLANPTGLYLEVGTFDLLDSLGRNFAFLNEVTNARTALVMIDFGNGRVDRTRVATDVKRNPDGTAAGISMQEALGSILEVDYETAPRNDEVDAEVLVRVEDRLNKADGSSFWFLMTSSERLLDPEIDFDDIILRGGDSIILAYVTDVDGDGLFAREEYLYGTKDSDPDTDGDGITDFDEVKVGWDIVLGETLRVYSDPLSADSDRDGLTDIEERDAGISGVGTGPTDPNSSDTDSDGLCDGPGRLDNNGTNPGELYYECRIGAGRDLRPLEPLLTTPPNLLVVLPLPNDLLADPNTDILARFTQKIDESSTFSVFGSLTGLRSGLLDFGDDPLTLIFDPSESFRPGEAVDVVLGDNLKNLDGLEFDFDPDTPESEAFVYRFQTRVVDTGSKGEFKTKWYAAEEDPFAITVADFDGDGDLDFATANAWSDDVSVLLNDGDDTFASAVSYSVGNFPRAITSADFNGDRYPDIATADQFSGVSVLLNNGDGSFAAAIPYTVQNRPQSIAAADLNGDGYTDLVTSNVNPDHNAPDQENVAVLLNNGNGSFAAAVSYPAGDTYQSQNMTEADFDGDGDIDLAVTEHTEDNTLGDNILILLNDGDGIFSLPVSYPVGNNLEDLTATDLDGDGDFDLAVTNFSPARVEILLNEGNGTFIVASPVTYPVSSKAPTEITAADLDNDGDADLATSNVTSDNTSVLLNLGNATFAAPVPYLAGNSPTDIAAADFDGDGRVDLATTHQLSDDVFINSNEGAGTFAEDRPGVNSSDDITTADLDGDGDLDLATANGVSGDVSVILNTGDGNFAASSVNLQPYQPRDIASADLDGDGDPDLVTANTGSDNVAVVLNSGDGVFALYSAFDVADQPRDIAVANLDGDGNLDIVTANGNFIDGVSVLFGDGDGFFALPVNYQIWEKPTAIAAADFDGNGGIDLAVSTESTNVWILFNDGNGVFEGGGQNSGIDSGSSPVGLTAADLDGDGDIDMATINDFSDDISVLLNNGDATFATPRRYPGAMQPIDISAADLDADGDIDLAIIDGEANDVVHLINDGQGRFIQRETYRMGVSSTAVTAGDLDGDGDLDLATANGSGSSDSFTILYNGDSPR